jgi:hypothetical protein
MLELTRSEERTFQMYRGVSCLYTRSVEDPELYGWGIGQLRAALYSNSSARNFDNRLLLGKLLLLYPDQAKLYIPISTGVHREFRPVAELWSYADTFYYQRERKMSASRIAVTNPAMTTLYNIGLVAVGGVYSTCVPWSSFKELYKSLKALMAEEGRRTDCTVCGLPKVAYKICPWCKTALGEKSDVTSPKKNYLREAVTRERDSSSFTSFTSTTSTSGSVWNPTSNSFAQSNDEEGS